MISTICAALSDSASAVVASAGRFRKMDPGRIDRIGFDASADLVHHRHGLDRKCPGCAFGRQHDRVRAFVNGVGDIADLGPRRGRRNDHRFQHLGGDHHRLSGLARSGDDPVLQRRNALGRKLDAEVAASDHHRVGQLQYLVQPVDRLGLLDLGQQRRRIADQLARFGHVFRSLDEGQGNEIGALFQREFQVFPILLGQGRDRHQHIGDVDPLVVADLAADLDHRGDLVLLHRCDPEVHLAVVDQQAGVLFDRLEQFGVRQFDAGRIPQLLLPVEHEHVPVDELGRAILEFADPKLRTLKVEQDRDRAMLRLLERADRIDQLGFLGLAAVAHVDAEGVGARLHQRADHVRAGRCRAQGGQDLHLALARSQHRQPVSQSPHLAIAAATVRSTGLRRAEPLPREPHSI